MISHKIRLTSQKIAQRIEILESLVYRQQHPLALFHYHKLPGSQSFQESESQCQGKEGAVINWHSYWGEYRANFILRTHFQVPESWVGHQPIALYLPLGDAGEFSHPEALAYIDGRPWATCDRHHQEILLPPVYCDGKPRELVLHGWVGNLCNEPAAKLFMRECTLVLIDQPTRDLLALARVALGVAGYLESESPAKAHLYNALDTAFMCLDLREPFGAAFYASISQAYATLESGIARCGPALDVDITAVGHAHIDVAWLWTLAQTRRKSERTFYNVIRLMEQFPEFRFVQSQPQLYAFVQQACPALFEQIKQRVNEGRWEPIGGMWVEADCNLSGPESLVRQFLLGRSFFRDNFGKDAESPVLWLPDVFGYAWNLPQLIKEAGLDYFFTIKIGWNEYNRLPYDSFWWQGLDGTRVLTHFSTTPQVSSAFTEATSIFTSTYNADASPEQTLGTWRNFQQQDAGKTGVTPPLLMAFGYGDGGGGPTREMLENIHIMQDFPATPHIHCGTVKDFFARLESTVGERLPVWDGELYLENHRGTYTTQSRNKRANRLSEFLLHDAEFLASYASLCDVNYVYPAAELQRAWELVCLNQFHDIIPGSSIGEVYAESLAQYEEVRHIAGAICEVALRVLAAQQAGEILVVNPTSFMRDDLAFWAGAQREGSLRRLDNDRQVVVQPVPGGWLLDIGAVAPYSLLALSRSPAASEVAPVPDFGLQVAPDLLENKYLRVELNAEGDIIRIYDKVNRREVLPPQAIANQFQAFEDRPLYGDAWNIELFYEDKRWLAEPATSIEVVEGGPLRVAVEIHRRILNSDYVQRIMLSYNSPRLDFDTTIDWHERHILLKVAFPVAILSPVATYEIQWGNVQRPTHRNTSWDWARFETCAQKWVDLSEGGYGVSLLNDGKYGHDIYQNVMRLSLLRGTTSPDPEADQGEHTFTYSLYPHNAGWDARTVAAAYALNDPLRVFSVCSDITREAKFSRTGQSLVSVDRPNVVIETLKRAEDGQGLIMRLYENQRQRGPALIKTGFPLKEVWRVNLMEENQEPLDCESGAVMLDLGPYQIVSLRLIPAD
ncbi:MAG: alpha-mannosidase [Anaerolineae bacterium]|nr:alpha-mannosidase [Anaerolineae bacterium]